MFKHIRFGALALVLLTAFTFAVNALAAPPERVDVAAGEPGYVSVHDYVSRTDLPDVYKVTMSVQGSELRQQQFTDLVILLNTGHVHVFREEILSPDLVGNDAFGYRLDPATGQPTSTPRQHNTLGSGHYNIWNAMCYSAEQMIDLMFDPSFNPNYQNCRIAIVSYGNTANGRFDSPVWAGLTGYQDKDFLKQRIGALEARSPGTSNPVPLSKGVQAAYRLLEDEGTPLYFNPALSTQNVYYYAADFQIPYAGGTVNLPINRGTWTPMVNPLPANSITERFIVSLHSIGASGPTTSASIVPNGTAWYTTYPMDPAVTPINSLVTNPSQRLNYTDSMVGYFREGPGSTSATVYAYNWARYNILEVNSQLAPRNGGKKPYQTFALWIDPDQTTIAYPPLGRWMDFNESISQFPIPANTDLAHPFASSGWQPYSERLGSGSGKALYYYNDQGPLYGNAVYEGAEGVQYWSDAGVFRNVYSYATLRNELTDFISSISSLIGNKDGVVNASIASPFSLYTYPGQPLLSASHGTASAQGQNITWDIGDIPADLLTLTFYVKMDASQAGDLSYPIFSESYITYNMDTANGTVPQVKHFPMPFINPGGEIQQGAESEAGGSDGSPQPSAATAPEQGGLMPLFAMPYDSVKVHTPSVTPSRQALQEEPLQEREEPMIESENVADAGEETPVDTASQGAISVVLIAAFALLAIVFAAIALRHRRG